MTPPHILPTRHANLLILTIHNPPVNAFSPGIPEGLKAGLAQATTDDTISAVILIGGGQTFVAGADIKTFNLPRAQAPDLRGTVAALDACPKPVVAALHGTALGGGFELALACHYRVALPSAQMGLPEVKLGVLPGAGGTQRLPRVVGVQKALELMLSGRSLGAQEALELGLIDQIVPEDLLTGAIAFAQQVASVRPLPRFSERTVPFSAQPLPELIAQARAGLVKTHKGQRSPSLIVDLVEAAATLPFSQGWELEAQKFMEARESPQSRGMRHLFFAERAAAKVPGLAKVEPLPLKQIGVVGAGTMGSGIAMCFLDAGFQVTLIEHSPEALEKGLGNIRQQYEASVKRGRLNAQQVQERLERLQSSVELSELAQADLVIEAVFENLEVKRELFGQLDQLTRPECILATNTSTLDIHQIASATARPQQVIGLHFFSPAHIMKLLEIVRTRDTSDAVLSTCLQLGKKLKKIAVVVGVCYGFVGNRVMYQYREQASQLVRLGAEPAEVDAAVRALGLPMGPFEMSDLAGLDIGYFGRRERARALGQPQPDDWLDRLVEAGRKGQKTGGGIYDYPDGRLAVPSEQTRELLAQYRAEKGFPVQSFTPEQMQQRLLAALANEGAHILEESIAQRSSDIDVVFVYGYGFPPYRGGPMHAASERGLQKVVQTLESCGLTPAPLLRQLAREGKTFAQWDEERA